MWPCNDWKAAMEYYVGLDVSRNPLLSSDRAGGHNVE